MTQYLLYSEYEEYGGQLDEELFDELAFEAQAQIDWYTFSRLQNLPDGEEIPEAVKRCMYYLIKLLAAEMQYIVPSSDSSDDGSSGLTVASQSNDGVSISYNILSAPEAVSQARSKIDETIKRYLQGVTDSLGRKLLYRGLYPNE